MGRTLHFRNEPLRPRTPGGASILPASAAVNVAIVAADHRHVGGLARAIEAIPHYTVVMCCDSTHALSEASRRDSMDVCILDAQLPGLLGIEWVRRLSAGQPDLPILVWGAPADHGLILAALRAGAVGHLNKSDDAAAVAASLRQVLAGGSPLSPHIARELVREVQCRSTPTLAVELSPRERSVLRAISEGQGYKEIAVSLGIAPNTVHTHVRKIYAKLRVTSRATALRRAQELGIITCW